MDGGSVRAMLSVHDPPHPVARTRHHARSESGAVRPRSRARAAELAMNTSSTFESPKKSSPQMRAMIVERGSTFSGWRRKRISKSNSRREVDVALSAADGATGEIDDEIGILQRLASRLLLACN